MIQKPQQYLSYPLFRIARELDVFYPTLKMIAPKRNLKRILLFQAIRLSDATGISVREIAKMSGKDVLLRLDLKVTEKVYKSRKDLLSGTEAEA